MGISRSKSRARLAWRMSRSTRPALARLTSASGSPVAKWTTLSTSRLLYGSPQRRTGMWIPTSLPNSPTSPLRKQGRRVGLACAAGCNTDQYTPPLVALQEARHEKLLGQRRQHDAAFLTVVHQLIVVVEVNHLDDGPRLRR